MTPCCEHALFLHDYFFDFMFRFFFAMDGKIKQCVCLTFCVKLGTSATKTLEMLREAFGEHYLNWTVVSEWHSHFKASQVSDDKRSGQPSTRKTTENV
jgi:hypothetical protein